MSHKLVTTTTELYATLKDLEDAIKNGNGPMSFDQRTELLANDKMVVDPDDRTNIVVELVKGTDDVTPVTETADAAPADADAEDVAEAALPNSTDTQAA